MASRTVFKSSRSSSSIRNPTVRSDSSSSKPSTSSINASESASRSSTNDDASVTRAGSISRMSESCSRIISKTLFRSGRACSTCVSAGKETPTVVGRGHSNYSRRAELPLRVVHFSYLTTLGCFSKFSQCLMTAEPSSPTKSLSIMSLATLHALVMAAGPADP